MYNNQREMEARVYSNQELSRFMVLFQHHWIQFLLGKERTDVSEWMNVAGKSILNCTRENVTTNYENH